MRVESLDASKQYAAGLVFSEEDRRTLMIANIPSVEMLWQNVAIPDSAPAQLSVVPEEAKQKEIRLTRSASRTILKEMVNSCNSGDMMTVITGVLMMLEDVKYSDGLEKFSAVNSKNVEDGTLARANHSIKALRKILHIPVPLLRLQTHL
jgi:hypothetical protein